MRAFSSDTFVLPLPAGHRFPMAKYRRLRERVEAELPTVRVEPAPAAPWWAIEAVHDPAYVHRVRTGTLDRKEVRAIGFPWSPEMVIRSRRSVGATVAATQAALREGVGANLAGGTHHAGHARGQGYCVFNDVAVALGVARARHGVGRVAVVDLDVHQGNGTAEMLAGDPHSFTLSVHGQKNFPFHKAQSDLDLGLPDGVGDAGYLEAVERGLEAISAWGRPELVFYVAGVDPFEGDTLGRTSVSAEGLRRRDATVLSWAASVGAATVVCMAGGYAKEVEVIASLHLATLTEAAARCRVASAAPGPRSAPDATL